ncbi:MAG TPA: hypothetical protein VJW20_04310 [Candidatus Angelobacter sp.]|nr:hypothetical protein [Candidatus Angelobacter sp.]
MSHQTGYDLKREMLHRESGLQRNFVASLTHIREKSSEVVPFCPPDSFYYQQLVIGVRAQHSHTNPVESGFCSVLAAGQDLTLVLQMIAGSMVILRKIRPKNSCLATVRSQKNKQNAERPGSICLIDVMEFETWQFHGSWLPAFLRFACDSVLKSPSQPCLYSAGSKSSKKRHLPVPTQMISNASAFPGVEEKAKTKCFEIVFPVRAAELGIFVQLQKTEVRPEILPINIRRADSGFGAYFALGLE